MDDYYRPGIYGKLFPHNYLLQKGVLTPNDQQRLARRVYPFGNSTASSLNQYKKDIMNGNDYNLVGDSVGDLPSKFMVRNHTRLSVPRSNGAAAANNGYVLFAGGVLDHSNPSMARQSDVIDVWNEATKTWSLASLSVARQDLSAVAVGRYILMAGGWYNTADGAVHQSDVVDVWDAHTQTFLTPLHLSEARSNMCAVVLQGKVYFAGGVAGFYSQVYYSDRIDVFNSETQSWEQTMKLPMSRAAVGCGGVRDTILFGGGFHRAHYSSIEAPLVVSRLDVLNVTSKEWSRLNLLEPRANIAVTTMHNRYIVFAGGLGETTRSDMVNVFDVQLQRFRHYKLTLARSNAIALTIGYTAIIAGGIADGGTVDKGVLSQKEGQAMRASRLDIYSNYKRVTDIVAQNEWQQSSLATAASNQFGVASATHFYIAGGITNRRRTTDRVEILRRHPDRTWEDGVAAPLHYRNEFPQWQPLSLEETCGHIWNDTRTMGAPMHGHGCGPSMYDLS